MATPLPKTQLVHSDYRCWESGKKPYRAGALKLLRWFRKQKLPVDVLGIQSHLGFDYDLQSEQRAEWNAFLHAVTRFGINDQMVNGSFAEHDTIAAKVARDYLDLTLSYKQVKDVLLWGITDKYSWLPGARPRANGQSHRGTPNDDKFQPKPLSAVIAASLRATPKR